MALCPTAKPGGLHRLAEGGPDGHHRIHVFLVFQHEIGKEGARVIPGLFQRRHNLVLPGDPQPGDTKGISQLHVLGTDL